MNAHPEQELLSPFVDGELTEREQVTLEAHLASCAECREVLVALRATLGDLASLPEAVPSERDSWALRAAIATERRLDRRGRRWYLISGGAAAALVGILAFALSATNGGGEARSGAGAQLAMLGPNLQYSATNYTDSSARQVLLRFSGAAENAYKATTRTAPAEAGTGGFLAASPAPAMPAAGQHGSTLDAAMTTDADQAGLDRCIDTVTGSTEQTLTPRYYEAASFDGAPSFLLVFEVTEAKRLELWVVRRDDCQTLFFAQTRA